jgi:hypothetical protein
MKPEKEKITREDYLKQQIKKTGYPFLISIGVSQA